MKIINNDMFGIASRLKEIDSNYQLQFNQKLKRYEVHNLSNFGNTLSVVSPYEQLDRRLLDYVRRTRCERQDQIFAEIEENNRKIEQTAKKSAVNQIKDIVVELTDLLKRGEI